MFQISMQTITRRMVLGAMKLKVLLSEAMGKGAVTKQSRGSRGGRLLPQKLKQSH